MRLWNVREKLLLTSGVGFIELECRMKRGGVRGVREENRHHRQVLVTVELSLALFDRAVNLNS